jgi:hypothetical protein
MSDNVVKNPVPKNFQKKTEVLAQVNNGTIGTTTKVLEKEQTLSEKPKAREYDKVAIFSKKNVTWAGVGSVSKGYNIIASKDLDKWLTKDYIREATPQEVAEEFGL